MTFAPFELKNEDLDLLNESINLADNTDLKPENKKKPAISSKKTKMKEIKSKFGEKIISMYPDYYNIIPCRIEPYLDEDGNKIVKFPIKWEKYKTEKYPKEKLNQDIQTISEKGKYNSLAVMNGAISNNLIILDFDLTEGYNSKEFYNKILKHLPNFKNTLTEKSYRGGYHFHLLVDDMSCYESLDKKKIFKTIFGEWCKEIGIQGERKLTFIWSGNKYKVVNKVPPLKITNEQFLEIKESIEIKESTNITHKIKKETKLNIGSIIQIKVDNKFKKARIEFIDMLYGKFEVEAYAKKHKKKEFIYWKFFFREFYHKCGIEPEELFPLLKEHQPAFNLETTKTQLKHHPYTEPPMTAEMLKEYFPDYNIKESKKLSTKEVNEKYGKLQKEIPFDNFTIEIRENGIYRAIWKEIKKEWYLIRDLIMYGNLDILYKTIDNKGRNLFTFNFNNNQYNTHSIEDILKRLADKIYKGNTGRDIIKHCFNIVGDQLENGKFKAEYITGFNNGWKLPQTEIEKHFLLVSYTDYQTKTYNRAKNMIKEYSVKEKEKIKQKLKKFIDLTQTEKIKLAIIIGWSMSAPFRLAILEYCDIFPHLYNYGERNTGKSSLEKFWIVYFYKIYENYLSSTVLESDSRLEDHSSESTFPHNIQECHKVKNINAMPLLKDIATGISAFDRKKSAREVEFEKPKTAGFCLDSNNIVSAFKTPAFNTKCLTNEFTKKDVIEIDNKWRELYRKLKKEKLFSFIYEITKDWDNKIIFEKMDLILNQIKEIFKEENIDFKTIERENPRIISFYQIILFGIELFFEAFDIELEKKGVFKALIKGRQILPLELKEQFLMFCKSAIDFEEDTYEHYHDKEGNEYSKKVRGSNPSEIHYPLELDKDNIYYCFTQNNLRDFKQFSGKKYSMPELNGLISDALEKKDDIQYVNKRFNGMMTRYIQIKKNLF